MNIRVDTYCAYRPERQKALLRSSPVTPMRILPLFQDVLLTLEVCFLIGHPTTRKEQTHNTGVCNKSEEYPTGSISSYKCTKHHSDTHRPPSILTDPTVCSVFMFLSALPVSSPSCSSAKLHKSPSTFTHCPSKLGFSNTKAWMRQSRS